MFDDFWLFNGQTISCWCLLMDYQNSPAAVHHPPLPSARPWEPLHINLFSNNYSCPLMAQAYPYRKDLSILTAYRCRSNCLPAYRKEGITPKLAYRLPQKAYRLAACRYRRFVYPKLQRNRASWQPRGWNFACGELGSRRVDLTGFQASWSSCEEAKTKKLKVRQNRVSWQL